MISENFDKLFNAAKTVRENAHVPYSNFKVGAAFLTEDGSIPHYAESTFRASKVVLRPAGPGTGVIAGGAVRAVLELAGVKNVLTKIIGSTNAVNVVRATVLGLGELQVPEEAIARRRSPVGAPSDG